MAFSTPPFLPGLWYRRRRSDAELAGGLFFFFSSVLSETRFRCRSGWFGGALPSRGWSQARSCSTVRLKLLCWVLGKQEDRGTCVPGDEDGLTVGAKALNRPSMSRLTPVVGRRQSLVNGDPVLDELGGGAALRPRHPRLNLLWAGRASAVLGLRHLGVDEP